MVSSAIRLLTIVGLICAGAIADTPEHVNVWGKLNAQVTLGTSKSKIGIPFVQRSLDLSYPEVHPIRSTLNRSVDQWKQLTISFFFFFCNVWQDFNIDGPEANLNIVKGIKHTETTKDATCRPKAEIVKGGIDQKTATVRVTSERGCALDSLVEFYIERQGRKENNN